MADDDQQNDTGGFDDVITADGDNAGNDQGDSDSRNSRQIIGSLFSKFRQQRFNSQTKSDRYNNDLNDAPEHSQRVKSDFLSDKLIGDERSKNR